MIFRPLIKYHIPVNDNKGHCKLSYHFIGPPFFALCHHQDLFMNVGLDVDKYFPAIDPLNIPRDAIRIEFGYEAHAESLPFRQGSCKL